MAQTVESSAVTEKEKILNPRSEIDTSPPFESVKEAVDRFGGSGPWIPLHLLRLAAAGHHQNGAFDVEKIEEQTVKLERDLIMKEEETMNILKELESAKRYVEGLKFLMSDTSSFLSSPDLKLESHVIGSDENSTVGFSSCPQLSPGLMFMQLNQAKLNLSKTSGDLAVIQASVESLNQKMRRDKGLLEKRIKMQLPNSDLNKKVEMTDTSGVSLTLSKEIKEVNFEVDQFKKMTEASRYEVIKAMAEIERTKNSIRVAEMRISAAKKMEEAAKAVEAIALAEGKVVSNGNEASYDVFLHKPDGITLTFEEYQALIQKAQQADDLCRTKFIDTVTIQRKTNEAHQVDMPILEKFEAIAKQEMQSQTANLSNATASPLQQCEINSNKFKFRNSHPGCLNENELRSEQTPSSLHPTPSIGDILSRKLILQDEVVVRTHDEDHSERQHVSLSQMLREHSRLIVRPPKGTAEGNVEKQYFMQRKKFGFIQMPLSNKQSKKKTHPLNIR